MAIITFPDEAAWHRLRAQNVGASEVAALFNISPWTTRWKLYMAKTGQLPHNSGEKWMARGRHFEAGVASYAREELEIDAIKVDYYITDDTCQGLGSSLDYSLNNDVGVPVEIKWVEKYDGWEWTGSELTQIPDYYVLQVQQQMACTGAAYGYLLAFIAGDVRSMRIPRSDAIINAIRTYVREFWEDVTTKKEPPVDFLKDAETIFDIAAHRPLRTIELPIIYSPLFDTFIYQTAQRKEAEDKADAAKAELIKLVLDAGMGNDGQAVASCGDFTMKLTKVDPNPGKVVTAAMVGEIIGVRKGFLRTTIGKKKEK